MTKNVFAVLVAAAALSLPPSVAEAQLTRVDPDCDEWMGVNVLNQFNPDASACAGAFAGNDAQLTTAILGEIASQGWGTASYLGTTDAGQTSGPFSEVGAGTTGIIRFDSALTGQYVVALKAGDSFSLYYFANLMNASQIEYYTIGTGGNWAGPPHNPRWVVNGLSHASLYSISTVSVPEPGTMLLLLTGFAALAVTGLRRREA